MQILSSPHRILVVDDNRDAAELLQMLLQLEGYVVQVAFDGADGLKKASDFRPDVICLDQRMPFLSGTELAVELRKSDHSREVHLIAMTGLDDDQNRDNITAAGFDACLCKPFDFTEFLMQMNSYFKRRGATKRKSLV
jgi:DNA-binding response OmpR family regulator